MKLLIYFIFQLLIYLSCTASPNKNISECYTNAKSLTSIDSLSLQERAQLLEKYAVKIEFNEEQVKYFQVFPSDFQSFKAIFGYEDIDAFNSEYGPLYMDSETHIHIFFTKLNVNKDLFSRKVIDIASKGEWQADAINLFQSYLMDEVNNNVEYYVDKLSFRSKDTIKGFWLFFFSGPHPESYRKVYNILVNKIEGLNRNIASLVKESYEELTNKDEH